MIRAYICAVFYRVTRAYASTGLVLRLGLGRAQFFQGPQIDAQLCRTYRSAVSREVLRGIAVRLCRPVVAIPVNAS
jgi:hypothetical protein